MSAITKSKRVWIMLAALAVLSAPVLQAAPAGGGKGKKKAPPAGQNQVAKPAAEPTGTYPSDYRPPLAYGREFVEVTGAGVLRGRYRFWGDWDKEFASFLEDAKAAAKARGTPCRKVTMGCIFLKNATITLQDIKGGDGQPMTATYSTPQAFIDEMNNRSMKEYADYMFTWSGGELQVDWVVETLENMHWVQTGQNMGWGCQPKQLGDQLLKALAKYKNRDVCMWMFCASRPETKNPAAGGTSGKKKGGGGSIGAPPYGISYTQWPIYGGRSLVITGAKDIGLMIHEANHRYLDGLRELEGIVLTRFHGLAALGFSRCGFPNTLTDSTYRFVFQFIIPRDMWRRFTITTPNRTPHEPFSGKAYAWDAVKNDCWFKLPDLTDGELAKLTGVASVKIEGSRADKTEECRSWVVAAQDAGRVLSPYAAAPAAEEAALNNILKIRNESCAVLKTATGTWLLVKKDLADVYADMLKLSGKGPQQIPVYGYVNRDVLPLVVFKAPADLPLPTCEEGFFRTPAAGGHAK